MGWGSKQTTTSTNTATNSNTTTPNLNPIAQNLYGQLSGEAHNLIANANKPVYGDAQKADVLNNLNDLANSASKHLNSSLASRGALGSGDFDLGQSQLEQQRFGNLSNFYSNLPALEDQAHQQKMLSALGFGAGLAGQMPVGQTSVGDASSTGQQQQTSSPGLSGILGGVLGSVAGGLTGGLTGGLGSMLGGGSFGGGFQNAMNPMQQFFGGPAGSPPNMFNPSAMPSYAQLPMQLQQRPIPWSQ